MLYHHYVGFKLNSWKFSENVGIEMSYTWCKNLLISLKTQKNEEKTSHVFYRINYIGSHIEFIPIRWVVT